MNKHEREVLCGSLVVFGVSSKYSDYCRSFDGDWGQCFGLLTKYIRVNKTKFSGAFPFNSPVSYYVNANYNKDSTITVVSIFAFITISTV